MMKIHVSHFTMVLFLWGSISSVEASINEWAFKQDAAGLSLSQAYNSGTDGAAAFSGTDPVTKTDGIEKLICSNQVDGVGNYWSDGAILKATVDQSAGVRYLRYDFSYDTTARANDSGSLLGMGFVDGGNLVAGIAFDYNPAQNELPAGYSVTEVVSELDYVGQISVIAKVDLNAHRISVWYDLTGANAFNITENAPDATATISLTSIDQLEFRATGDFLPGDSSDGAAIDHIRTSSSWEDISRPVGGDLLVSADSLTLPVVAGRTASAAITLKNYGQSNVSFTVTSDENMPQAYPAEPFTQELTSFFSPSSRFNNWAASDTVPMALGFDFPMYDTVYTSFSVSQYGYVTLFATNGATAQLAPFKTTNTVDQSTVRYLEFAGRIVIAWGNGTGREFQLRLDQTGSFAYFYQPDSTESWTNGAISYSAVGGSMTYDYSPGESGSNAIQIDPVQWVTINPLSGTVGSGGVAQSLTVTADAGKVSTTGTYHFSMSVNWGTGQVDPVDVTVIVSEASFSLAVPSTFSFSGPAGFISPSARMQIRNDGTEPVTYRIKDSVLADAGYTTDRTDCRWKDVPLTSPSLLEESLLDTTPVTIGFPVTVFGTTYTEVTVGLDGTLTFGSQVTVQPYSGSGLSLDDNARVLFMPDASRTHLIVTWMNMAQSGGGADQTFQAVLGRDGTITFNYKNLTGAWTNGAIIVSDGNAQYQGTLINADTTVTNYIPIVETIVTNITFAGKTITKTIMVTNGTETIVTYADRVNDQALVFVPGAQKIITASPVTGTLLPAASMDITLTGDARSLTAGGANDVSLSTDLLFVFSQGRALSAVTFTATNSTETVYPSAAVAAAMWGTEDPVVLSLLNSDGSRVLSWPAAADDLGRTYKIWYTTDLTAGWTWLATVENATGYTDSMNVNVPIIFYKVTVE